MNCYVNCLNGRFAMVVAMQKLTSLSSSGTTLMGLQERPDASLVWTSSAEPLNAMVGDNLSPVGIGEGKSNPTSELEWTNSPRISVVDKRGVPLMPCKAVRARLLLKKGKAIAKWNKLGIFYIQLTYAVEPNNQILVVGVDPGTKYEAISVVGKRDTVLNIMLKSVDWVKKALEQRRNMRRARRYRKTRRRPCRFNNRLSRKNWLPPSVKARWDVKFRIISQLKKILPVTYIVVEDIKAVSKKKARSWNINFSPIEVGKQYFYTTLNSIGLKVILKEGWKTKLFRDNLGLKKIGSKFRPIFESQCVDSWCLASMVAGTRKVLKSLYYMVPLRFHRRQLHRFQPSKGGIRPRYGGTLSFGLKRGTLVRHIKYGLCYIGGNLRGRFSLHSLQTGKRITQNAKRGEFKILTKISFRTRFFSGNFSVRR